MKNTLLQFNTTIQPLANIVNLGLNDNLITFDNNGLSPGVGVERLPAFLTTFKHVIDKLIGTDSNYGGPLYKEEVVKFFSTKTHLMLVDNKLICPVGLSVTFTEYVKALEAAFKYAVTLITNDLPKYVKSVGECLDNPQILNTMGLDMDIPVRDTDAAINRLKECHESKSDRATMRYGDAIKANKDWGTIVEIINELKDSVDASQIKKVYALVKDGEMHTSKLVDLIATKKVEINRANMVKLQTTVFTMAESTQFFAMVVSLIINFRVMVIENYSTLVDMYSGK